MANRRSMLGVLLAIALLASSASASLAQPAVSGASPAPAAAPGSMLMVENAGQWPAAARFQVWNSPLGAGTTWLAEDAIWLVVARGTSQVADPEAPVNPLADLQPANLQPATFHALKLTFPGSNPNVRIEPFQPADTVVSYFYGNDPAQWRPDVPVWYGVRYVDLYPGVDLVIGGPGNAWRLEAAPDATVEPVRVKVDGAYLLGVDGGLLQVDMNGQQVSIAPPFAEFNYRATSVSTHGESAVWLTSFPKRSSVQTSPPDDPNDLLYSTYLGGSSKDSAHAIAVDSAGNAHVTGRTSSSDFPTTPGIFDPGYNGGSQLYGDIFVSKLDPSGSMLLYSTFVGGGDDDKGNSIAIDEVGNAYITGDTLSPDFPVTPQAFDTTFNYFIDAFVLKLDPTGTTLAYSTFLGGTDRERGLGIVTDVAMNVYVTGMVFSDDFPTTPSSIDPTSNGGWDVFISKLDPTGSQLIFSTFLGGYYGEQGSAIALDRTGNIFITGYTSSLDFPVTPNAFDTSHNGDLNDGFVAKLNSSGSELLYSTYLGSESNDAINAIAVDLYGNAYVTGYTGSSDFPVTPVAYQTCRFRGADNAFVAKFNPSGSDLAFATCLGGNYADGGISIAIDGTGGVYVTGWTTSSDFPITSGAFDTSLNYGLYIFVTRLSPSGSELFYSTFFGIASYLDTGGIALDAAGNTYVAGIANSDALPVTIGAFDTSYNGDLDAFVAKFRLDPYAPDVVAPVELPAAGTFISATTSLRGFAIDQGSSAGTGVDTIHVYLDGPYGTGTIIGGAAYGLNRTDVAAEYGERFGPSGWELDWDTSSVTPGPHWLYLYAHRTTDNAWSLMPPHLVVVAGGHTVWFPLTTRR